MKRFFIFFLFFLSCISCFAQEDIWNPTPQSHNDLTGLNDGDSFEHLTSVEKDTALNGSTSVDLAGKVITANNGVRNSGGTAVAPSYSFTNDFDTGIYSPGVNALGVSIGGELFFSLRSSGDCALIDGHAYNDARLRLVSDATGRASDNGFMLGTIGSDTYLYNYSTGGMFFATSATERMRITSGGNVLIAKSTDDGANKLQVNGTARFLGLSAGTNMSVSIESTEPVFRLRDTDGTANKSKWDIRAIGSTGYEALQFRTINDADDAFITRLAIKPDTGNVTIGLETNIDTGEKLQVNGNIKADKTLVTDGTAAAPAYTFSSDPDTGIYSPGANRVSMVTGGASVFDVRENGVTINGAINNADGDIADLMAMVNGFNPRRWGIKIAKATADPYARVEYLYDAVGMTPAAMNYTTGVFEYGDWKPFCDAMNRPVMLNPDGTVAYELDKSDQTKKLDGTASGISSTAHNLNAMSEFKRLWLRTYEDATYQYIIFSNVQYDENYHANAFTDASGNIRDRMYYAMFEGSNVGSKMRSLATGAVMANQTAATEISYAEANGAGWHINYKSQRDFITYLLALISKSTNSQAVFGQGNSSSAAYIAPGALKDKGRFWGDDATDVAVKVFFIEHFWGNYWKRMSGLLYNETADILIKATPPYSLTGVGYTNTDVTPTGTSGEYITAGTVTDAGFLPTTAGGSDSTYFTDALYYSTPAAGVFNVALVGGARSYTSLCGSWACFLGAAGVVYPDVGASLSFLKYAAYGQ